MSPTKKAYGEDIESGGQNDGTKPLLTAGKSGPESQYGTRSDESSDSGGSDGSLTNDQYYMGVDKATLLNTPEEGLTEVEAERRLQLFGTNELSRKEENVWVKLALEFVQPMPLMIWAAILIESLEAYVHSSPDDVVDVLVLIVLQLLNVLVGFIEELKAGDSIAALRDSLKPEAIVKRENKIYLIIIYQPSLLFEDT